VTFVAVQLPVGSPMTAFFRSAKTSWKVLPDDGASTSFTGVSLAQRFARHVSPLTTVVYTHASDQDLAERLRGLDC